MMAALMILSSFVSRPDKSTLKRPVQVRANFFQALDLPTREVYHYDIDIEPFLPRQKRKALWQFFEETHPEVVANAKSTFDGRKNVVSVVKFTLGETQAQAFPVDVANHPAFGRRAKDTIFTLRLKLANTINMQELTDFINSASSPSTTSCLTAIMLLDILARFLPSQTQLTYNRSINTPADKVPLSNGAVPIQGIQRFIQELDTAFAGLDMVVADPRKQCCSNIPLKVNVKLCGSNAPSVAARARPHHPCGIHPL